jgi:serine/threonine-protein kinase
VTERIGVYRVEGRLGQGGMGEVLLAWDDRLERRVAIKRIRQDAGLSPEQRERFRREARLAARLNHSSVVQIHDLVSEGPDDAIVMEYVEGQTMAECLKSGPLALDEALRLGREIAEGLAAAHEAGLIHRDLKAANVIVTKARRAKILDFGLARPVIHAPEEEPITRHGMVMGTFHAMSPEQARGEDLDERSDLFSFGALLYEMLTGRAPFRGKDAVDSLRLVVQEPSADPRSLRPDLPAEVAALLDRLLVKDRRDRPAGAGEVVMALERLRPASGSAPSFEETVSDLPTAPARAAAASNPPAPFSGLPPSTAPPGSAGRLGHRRPIAVGAVALLVLGLGAFWIGRRPDSPLRVAVARPEIAVSGDEQLGLASSGVLTATLSGLASLQGLAPIDPREAGRGGSSPVVMARAAAAEEVLTTLVERQGKLARVTLRRLQGADGRVLWTETFPVPMDPGSLRILADAVTVKIRQAYPGHDLRAGVPELDVRDEDYAAFLEIRQRIDAGENLLAPLLSQLETLLRSSPRFLEAHLLASRLAHTQFLARRRMEDLDRAAELVRQARALAPDDPRPLKQEIQIAITANRPEDARTLLEQLERLLPGDPEILALRAQVAEQQGRWDESAALLRTAIEQSPSWQNRFRLAFVEGRRGRIAEARQSIDEILRQAPDNAWAREMRGELELLYGDLARAEQIYLDGTRTAPRRSWNNLGMARYLRGRPQEAADAYRRALAIEPDHALTLINLGDAEVELGRTREAETLYRRALARLEESEAALGLPPKEAMLKAQCLARLGRSREAVELAQSLLRQVPDNAELLQQSALVHSLAGERTSALNNAADALEKGLQPRWFTGSAFRWLRESPELRSRFVTPGPS